jgi:regulator of nonsense transcripts 3
MNTPNLHALRKDDKRKAARAEVPPPSVGKKPKKGAPLPAPSKPIQIQTKSNTSGDFGDKLISASSSRPSGRSGRVRPAAKGPAEATPTPPTTSIQSKSPKNTTPAINSLAQPLPPASTATASSRRGRPVLGLGSRQFEAALNGVGVNGERKRKEKGKEPATATTSTQETNAQDKPVPVPVSPRKPRHRKEGPAIPDANGSSTFATQQGESTSAQANTHTGRGGRRGGRGRGRGGHPRVG